MENPHRHLIKLRADMAAEKTYMELADGRPYMTGVIQRRMDGIAEEIAETEAIVADLETTQTIKIEEF